MRLEVFFYEKSPTSNTHKKREVPPKRHFAYCFSYFDKSPILALQARPNIGQFFIAEQLTIAKYLLEFAGLFSGPIHLIV